MADIWLEKRLAEYIERIVKRAAKDGWTLTAEELAMADEMVRGNFSYFAEHWLIGNELKRYMTVSKALAQKLERSNPTPLAGDCVLIELFDDKQELKYPTPLLVGDYYRAGPGMTCVCVSAGPHIYDIDGISPEADIPMSVSGGYFHAIARSRLTTKPVGKVSKSFWFWGAGARGNGGLYINRQVLQWGLDNTEGFY